jgi:hypothetical protein
MEQRSATGGDHFVEDTYLAPQFGMLEFLRRLREDQLSVPALVDALNARGISTPRGGRWYAKSVSNLLAQS